MKCTHSHVNGFCPDCGQPVYVLGCELYYRRFKKIHDLGAAKILKSFINISNMEDFKKIMNSYDNIIHDLLSEFGSGDLDKITEDLKEGKGRFK